MKLYLLLVVTVAIIVVKGVSEDETEDMMEEDHRPFEDALVDAEDDLQQDDIAANDVQAEPAARRKRRKCKRGLHRVCHTLRICRYIKKKRLCKPHRSCFCGCKRGFRIACGIRRGKPVCGCVRSTGGCPGGSVRSCKRYRMCKKFKGRKICIHRRFCPCRCKRGKLHYCRRRGRSLKCKCRRKGSKCRRGEKLRCRRFPLCVSHKGYKHCELFTGCMCSRVRRG